MFVLSAFADEISPDPREQVDVLKGCKVRFVEFRSVHKTNVLALTAGQVREFKALLDGEGVGVSAIGSPVGKVPVDAPFEPTVDKLKRAVELCGVFATLNVRVFSFYPPADAPFAGDWGPYRDEVVRRMRVLAETAAAAGVTLFHENEHNIFGDTPERVRDLLSAVAHPNLRAAYDAGNYVTVGADPVRGWELTKEFTAHLHIKDWKSGDAHTGRLAGHGDGRLRHAVSDAVRRGYDGFAVLEPHLRGGGPTGGVTGPDLFPVAVAAFRDLLRECGGAEG